MDGPTARLVIRQGPTAQPEYQLGTQAITIGRESSNDIVVNDPEISRRHTRITFQDGRYLIEDLNSTNGTFVNGQRIGLATPLNNNDTIDISNSVKITFYGSGTDAGATIIEQSPDQLATPAVGRFDQEPQPPPFRQPPPAYGSPPAPPPPTGRDPRRILVGCGCLVLLAVMACAASLFLVDALAPDLIYCGPLQPLFELLGFALSCA